MRLNRAQWRAAMESMAATRMGGASPTNHAANLDSSKLIHDVLAAHRNGTPTVPHWTALPLLP